MHRFIKTAGVRTRAPLFVAASALALLAGSWTAAPAPAGTTPTVPRTQELAVFLLGQTAMARPDSRSARRVWVDRNRPAAITWLGERIGPGVPVTVRG